MARPTPQETEDFTHAAHVTLCVAIGLHGQIHSALLAIAEHIKPKVYATTYLTFSSTLDHLGEVHTSLLDLSEAIENHLDAMKEPECQTPKTEA